MPQRRGILILTLLIAAFTRAQTRKADSLMRIVMANGQDTCYANALNLLSWELREINYDTAVILAGKSLSIAKKNNWKKLEANALHNLSWYQTIKGDLNAALTFGLQALAIRKTLPSELETAKSYANISIILREQGNYLKSLEFSLAAIKIAEGLHDSTSLAVCYGNIGSLYSNMHEDDKAIDYHFKSLRIKEARRNKLGQAYTLSNIGAIYREQKNYDEALNYFKRALSLSTELNSKGLIVRHSCNIATVYQQQIRIETDVARKNEKFNLCLECYLRALKICEEIQDNGIRGAIIGNLGSLYLDKMDLFPSTANASAKLAEKYILEALNLSRKNGEMNAYSESEQALALLYERTGRYRLAFEHYKRFIALRDSFFNQEHSKQAVKVEMNYAFGKKQAIERAAREKKQAVEREEKRRQNIILGCVAAGLVLVLVFAGFIFRAFKQKQKANIAILMQKEIIEEKQKEILDSIRYARRIQRSLLPTEKYIEKCLRRQLHT